MKEEQFNPIDNLIPIKERTPSELREMTKKGGKKSGQVRRQRKELKELFKSMLSTPIPQEELKEQINNMGFENEEQNYNTLVGMTTLQEAIKGNMKAIEFIRDTMGEKPKEEIELNLPQAETIKEIENYVNTRKE